MYCPNCGIRVEDADAFCADCGSALNRQQQSTPAQVQAEPAQAAGAATGTSDASGPTATSGPSWSGQAVVSRPAGKTIHTPSGEYELAGFGVRLGGFVIDLVIYGVVSAVLAAIIAEAGGLLLLFAAEWTFNAIGWSLGKRAVGLRIIGDDGQPPGAGKGFGRTLGAILSGIPFSLGYLWAAWDGKNQTWHDKMASTYVVRLRD